METEASFSGIAPAVFDGSNYELLQVPMEAYLKVLDNLNGRRLWNLCTSKQSHDGTNKSVKGKKKRQRKQRQRPACFLLSQPQFSQESCPWNQQRRYGIILRKNMKVMKELKACMSLDLGIWTSKSEGFRDD